MNTCPPPLRPTDQSAPVSSVIINSTISDQGSKLYKDVFIRGGVIGANCLIADRAVILESVCEGYNEVGRNCNLIQCHIDIGSCLSHNTTIRLKVKIGKWCCISWGVSIGGRNHLYTATSEYDPVRWKGILGINLEHDEQEHNRVGTTIGNEVWIGANAVIMDGITVGDGAIVGAGAVVTHDVPPYAIVVGNPARVLRMRFDQNVVEALLKMKWWDWSVEKIKENAQLLSRKLTPDILKQLQ